MIVRAMIEMLRQMNQDDEVVAWDADSGEYQPVSGAVHGGGDGRVELQTDDPS